MNDFPTLRELLEEAVRAEPRDHVFARWHEGGAWRTRTYAETLERVRALSEWFGIQGLVPRHTHVALLLPNSPEWLEIYLAIVGLAGTVVPIDPKLTPAELHHILSDSGAALLVTDPAHLKTLAGALPTLPSLRGALVVGGAVPEGLPFAAETLEAVLEAVPADTPLRFWDAPSHRPSPDDVCAILYTSGTTGKPKGAMLTHRNFSADALGALKLISGYVTPHDDFLVVLPLFHAFAFTANFVVALRAHATLSYLRSLRTLSEDLRQVRPTVLMTVPLMAEKLHARLMESVRKNVWGRLAHRLLPRRVGRRVLDAMGGRLRLIIVGGAKADQAILHDFNRMGIPMSEGYGLTECAPVVSVCPPERIRIGTIGPAIGGIEVRLSEADDQGVGELQVRGPITFRGYWGNPEATEAAYDGDWLRTGDLASLDAEGYITIRGRAKALIVNREGKNIYPEEVEQAIARDPLVGAVVVLAYATRGEPGEKVGALVSPNRDTLARLHPKATPEEIRTLLREAVKRQCAALAAYKHPRKIEVSLEPLTLTSTQKVRRCLYAGTLDEV